MQKLHAAVVNYAPEKGSVEIREIEKPLIGEEDVLLEVMNVGICGSDLLDVPQVVHAVDRVDEEHAWFSPVPGRSHQRFPGFAGIQLLVGLTPEASLERLARIQAFHELVSHRN